MKAMDLHDWLLLKIKIDWVQSSVLILLKNPNSEICHIQAEDFYDIHIPKLDDWGKVIQLMKRFFYTKKIINNISLKCKQAMLLNWTLKILPLKNFEI